MVAEEEDGLHPVAPIAAQPLDHLGGAGPAIDEVADEHQQGLGRRPVLEIGMDLGEKMLEKVDAAVDVPDRIGPIATGAGRALFASRREVEHQDPGLAASRPASMSRYARTTSFSLNRS